jgi:hypothetical protein
MMSIFLTEHLEQKIPTMENTQLVYYFFSFQDENRNTGVTLLQSLIYQIVTKRPQLKTHLLPYINFQRSEPSLEPLWAIFKKLIQDPELGAMLCVMDGLDESDKEATQLLLPRLVDLLSPASSSSLSTTFKLIVVSRDISGLEDCTRVKLDPDNNESVQSDIKKFISIRVRDLSKVVGSHHECEIEVQTTLLERAEGTFLWVGFAIHELMQKRTWTEVFDALKTLPGGLPAIYSRMIHQIPAERRQTSSRILQWVTTALRPLKLLEIANAIGLKSSSSSISLEHAIMDEITLCGSFLKVKDSEVTLIHQSVRDYLLNERQQNDPVLEAFQIKANEAHLKMAQTCLECVQQSILQHEFLDMQKPPGSRESPLLRYAAQHWLQHAALCSDLAGDLFDSTQFFFAQNCPLRDNLWRIYTESANIFVFTMEPPPLLHIACVLEIFPWVKIMVNENCSTGSEDNEMLSRYFLDQRDMNGKTALHHASLAGNYLIVQLLVQSGADVSAEYKSKTALHFAATSRKCSGEIVQFLLDQGAEIDAAAMDREMAFEYAIEEEEEKRQNIPIRHGRVRLGWASSCGLTVLRIAVERRDINTVQLLLDRGASLEKADSRGSTVLHIAVERGDMNTVQLLLDNGADIQARNLKGETTLHLATGHHLWRAAQSEIFGMKMLGIVQLLLDRGADKDARDSKGIAAFNNPRYIKFLESLDEAVERPQKRSRRE